MRISDWSSDVCSSDLSGERPEDIPVINDIGTGGRSDMRGRILHPGVGMQRHAERNWQVRALILQRRRYDIVGQLRRRRQMRIDDHRSEEHTSELQSLMRIAYCVF